MVNKITIDGAGRIVIPKSIQSSLRLLPGDELELEATDTSITLKPIRESASLVREQGIWVYRTDAMVTNEDVSNLIDEIRGDRMKELEI